jgi:cell division septal protein FtsQ
VNGGVRWNNPFGSANSGSASPKVDFPNKYYRQLLDQTVQIRVWRLDQSGNRMTGEYQDLGNPDTNGRVTDLAVNGGSNWTLTFNNYPNFTTTGIVDGFQLEYYYLSDGAKGAPTSAASNHTNLLSEFSNVVMNPAATANRNANLSTAPLFIIDQVTVTGTDDIRARQIEEMFWQASDTSRFYVLSQAHLPLLNSESLKLEILNRYNLETVEIQKKIPKTISITIKEKVPAVVWFEADIYYILDSFGYILNIATGPVTDLPIIYNNNQVKINESGKQIMNQEAVIKMASELKPQLINALSYLKVNQMTVTHEQNTLTLVLKDGPLIYLATNEALGTQLERLTTLLRTDLKNRLNKLTYIDLRFGDKIYYK